MANVLQTYLGEVRDELHGVADAVHFGTFGTLPMVDNLAGDVEDEFDQIIQPIHDAIVNLDPNSEPTTALQTALFNALGPSHLGILVDPATSSTTNVVPADVSVTDPGQGADLHIEARLFIPVATAEHPANFDLGLPGLPFQLSSAGQLTTTVGMAYEMSFDFAPGSQDIILFDTTKTLAGFTPPAADGSFPSSFQSHQLAFFVSTTPSADFSASARLGFVEGDLTPVDPSTDSNSANGLSLAIGVDKVTNLTTPVFSLEGDAEVNMTLHGGFATGNSDDFPGIDTDLHFSWQIDSMNSDLNKPKVSFDHVDLDLGHVISDLIKPMLDKIHDATKSLDPVLDILNTPIPGLSNLANAIGLGNVTLLTLAGAAAPFSGYGPLFDLADKVTKLLTLVENIEKSSGTTLDSTLKVPLGGFDLDDTDLTNLAPAGDIEDADLPDISDLSPDDINALINSAQDFQAAIANLGLPPLVTSLFNQVTAGLETNQNQFSIDFPILDDPAGVVFNMLLGRDSDLASLTAKAHVVSEADLGPTGLSILGQGIDYDGKVNLDLNFKFAYDTFGLRELINQLAGGGTVDVLSDIGDGFYIGGDSFFNMAGSINADAGLSLGIFDVSVSGGASTGNAGQTPVSVTVDDPPADGKKRFDGTQMFNTSGEFVAGLHV
ncbi:MAG TPA: hypothetical protein VHV08_14560, partial [Pirellulales bacterium]|nr:hypothetical protein [Pirellulales bacterium]